MNWPTAFVIACFLLIVLLVCYLASDRPERGTLARLRRELANVRGQQRELIQLMSKIAPGTATPGALIDDRVRLAGEINELEHRITTLQSRLT